MNNQKRRIDDDRSDNNKKQKVVSTFVSKQVNNAQNLPINNKRPVPDSQSRPQQQDLKRTKVVAKTLGNPLREVRAGNDPNLLNCGKVVLRAFDIKKINTDIDGKRVLISGQSGSGKSSVTLDIIKANRKIPAWAIFSPTEATNHTFGPYVHPGAIHDDLSIPELRKIKKRQETVCTNWQIPSEVPGGHKKYKRNPSIGVILDDCNVSPALFKDDVFKYAYFNSRHHKVLFIQITQHPMSVPNMLRRNVSHFLVFAQKSPKAIKTIHEEYGAVIEKLPDFKIALQLCTENKMCMVIDCLTTSLKIEENIYFYKATHPAEQPPFKIGAAWWWAQMDKLYNPDWKENLPEEEEEEDEPKAKKGKKKTTKSAKNDNLNIELDNPFLQ
jgi:hypothetical protein